MLHLEKTGRRKKRSLGTSGSMPQGNSQPDPDFETNAKFLTEFMTLNPVIRKKIGHK